jgi:hypothetical protein
VFVHCCQQNLAEKFRRQEITKFNFENIKVPRPTHCYTRKEIFSNNKINTFSKAGKPAYTHGIVEPNILIIFSEFVVSYNFIRRIRGRENVCGW